MRRTLGLYVILSLTSTLVAQPVCTFVGDASPSGDNCYQITDDNEWELGAVWFNEPLNLSQSFTIDVEVSLGSTDADGADGIVFVMQDVGPFAIGMAGGGLGFEGFNPSFGIEIDTWQNGDLGDPIGDHVAFLRDGVNNHNAPYFNLAGPVLARSDGANIEDGQPHRFRLDWDEPLQQLTFLFDCEVRLSLEIDLVGELFNGESNVWWGFTGSTGGSSNVQEACITSAAVGLPPEFQVCEGTSVPLQLEATNEGTVTWEPPQGLSSTTTANTVATPEETTTYTATWTDVCGEELSATTTVEVVALPDPDLPASVSICPEEIAELTVTIPVGGSAIWSDGTQGPEWEGDEAGELSVEVITEEGCIGTASSLVELLLPQEIELPEIQALCEAEVFLLDWPIGTESWTVDGSPEAGPWAVTAGDYALEGMDIETGCPLLLDLNVPLLAPETPTLVEAYATCAGEGVELELNAGEGATISWSPVIGLSNANAEQPIANPQETTQYTATVTDLCGVTSALLTSVSVFDIPNPGLPDSVSICPGESVTLTIEPLSGVSYPLWSDGSTGWSWTGVEEGWQSVEVVPLPQCPGADSTFIGLHAPEAPVFEVEPLCPGEFTFLPWPDGWSNWQVDGASADPDGLTITEPGVFFLVAEEDMTGCGVVSSVVVPTGALSPIFLPEVVELCEDQTVTLDAGVPEPAIWDDGVSGPSRTIESPGIYTVTHTTDCGSVSHTLEVIEVSCGCAVFAPTAFTPDGDFVNDAWRPSFECEPEEFRLIIFDRWGTEIWYSEDYKEYWTGGVRRDGRPLDERLYYVRDGVYAFQITYRDPSSVVRKIIRKTGFIMILR